MKMLLLKLDITVMMPLDSVSEPLSMLIILNMPLKKFTSTFQLNIHSMEKPIQWKSILFVTHNLKVTSKRKWSSHLWLNLFQEDLTNSQTNSTTSIYQTLSTTELNSQSQMTQRNLKKSPLKISGELKKMTHSTDTSPILTITDL